MEIDEKQLVELITKIVMKELNSNRIVEVPMGDDPKEVVIGVGPAFMKEITKNINGINHEDILREIAAGIEEEGMHCRIVKIYKTSDVSFIGKEAAMISGSGIAIGLQSKGTLVIHQKDLYPLSNLELFSQAPLLNLAHYRKAGKNAAIYAKGQKALPVEIINDPMSRPSYQVKAALMHIKESELVNKNRASVVFTY